MVFKSCSLEVAKKKKEANLNIYLFKPEGETFFVVVVFNESGTVCSAQKKRAEGEW